MVGANFAKVRVANVFFFSSLWYSTEIWDPGGGRDSYGGVEK